MAAVTICSDFGAQENNVCHFILDEETLTDFIWGDLKITVDGDCSHETKRQLLLGRKAMANLDSALKNRDITLPTKICIVKDMVFPVVVYRCES